MIPAPEKKIGLLQAIDALIEILREEDAAPVAIPHLPNTAKIFVLENLRDDIATLIEAANSVLVAQDEYYRGVEINNVQADRAIDRDMTWLRKLVAESKGLL